MFHHFPSKEVTQNNHEPSHILILLQKEYVAVFEALIAVAELLQYYADAFPGMLPQVISHAKNYTFC